MNADQVLDATVDRHEHRGDRLRKLDNLTRRSAQGHELAPLICETDFRGGCAGGQERQHGYAAVTRQSSTSPPCLNRALVTCHNARAPAVVSEVGFEMRRVLTKARARRSISIVCSGPENSPLGALFLPTLVLAPPLKEAQGWRRHAGISWAGAGPPSAD